MGLGLSGLILSQQVSQTCTTSMSQRRGCELQMRARERQGSQGNSSTRPQGHTLHRTSPSEPWAGGQAECTPMPRWEIQLPNPDRLAAGALGAGLQSSMALRPAEGQPCSLTVGFVLPGARSFAGTLPQLLPDALLTQCFAPFY